MVKFKFLENITTADAAFLAYGKTLPELFENTALALFETMAETKKVKPAKSYRLQVTGYKFEDLLFDFLSELVFLKDEQGMVFSKFKVKIKKLDASRYSLDANIWGEKINPTRHNLKVDVKAVTRHLFTIKKEEEKFLARVVLDI